LSEERRVPRLWIAARPVVLVAVICISLFSLFLEVTPPGSSPDEISHFIRIGGIVSGHPFGTPPDATTFTVPGLNAAQIRRVRLESGIMRVSSDYVYALGSDCNAFRPAVPACAAPLPATTAAGGYQLTEHARSPLGGYLLPAALSVFGWSGRSTFFLTRFGVVLANSLLLSLGFWSVRRVHRGSSLSLVAAGMAIAMTPLAAFLAGVLAPSSEGITGSVCLLMCTWSVARVEKPAVADRAAWLFAVAAASTAQGLGFVFAGLAIVVALLTSSTGVREFGRHLSRSVAAIGTAILLLALAWDLKFKIHVPSSESILSGHAFVRDLHYFWTTTLTGDTLLGWLDVQMPTIVTTLWVGFFGWVLVGGLILGNRSWSRSVLLMVALYVAIGLVFTRAYQPTGYGLQPRYFLPALCLFPVASALRVSMLGGWVWRRLRPRLVICLWLVAMVVAVYTVLRRHVVGASGPIWVFGHGIFRPLGGWMLSGLTLGLFVSSVAVSLLYAPRLDSTSTHDDVQPIGMETS
jgi:Predicted membrane protein (DUF2142)